MNISYFYANSYGFWKLLLNNYRHFNWLIYHFYESSRKANSFFPIIYKVFFQFYNVIRSSEPWEDTYFCLFQYNWYHNFFSFTCLRFLHVIFSLENFDQCHRFSLSKVKYDRYDYDRNWIYDSLYQYGHVCDYLKLA